MPANPDPEVELRIPANDVAEPELSIVIPAMNEEITIGEFVDWCREGIAKANVRGEILIVDSSTDSTPEIALARGARVLKTPKRGLGRAYIDSLNYIRGKYILMGDADLTYDFREISEFVKKFREGSEYIMGSRFRGSIEDGAMPPLHRYFGTPATTMILNLIYGSHFTDIHCGMRGITLEALKRIKLESESWEYASELVLKAVKYELRIAEIPIRFYKDRPGRLSHHKRSKWYEPWRAGWINLKAMFLFAPDFFLMIPGVIGALAGLLLVALSASHLFAWLSLHWMLLGMTLTICGYSAIQMAILSKVFYNFIPEKIEKYSKLITYNRGVAASAIFGLTSLAVLARFAVQYFRLHMTLSFVSESAIVALYLLLLSFQTFTFTLMFQMIVIRNKSKRKERSS
ncbi:MAG TPA: glycosyltransferase family 2 protein [Candidatus Baltobacteraceae bacterium]|nr:glycosyltransferase family 2 protein [Candidatus Baltobacteraceae bacterium]